MSEETRTVLDPTAPRAPAAAAPNGPSGDASLAERLAELRRNYETQLGAKVDAVAQALAAARDRGLLDELKRAHQLAHRLHGTAGSYGFGALGSAAGQLEHAIVAQLRDPTSDRRWSAITTALAELEREVQPYRQGPATPALPLPAPRRANATGPELPRVSSTLLLVTNDPALRLQATQAAMRALTTVVVASGLEDALLQARTLPIDAALLDVDPERPTAAIELARRLRHLPGRLSLPLAFLSHEGSLQARVAATHAGASLFLTRPLGDQELTSAVRQLCNREAREHVRLLLVDDDPHFLEVLRTVLRAEQIDVHTLAEAHRVVEELDRVRPDLLLVDLMMPGVNGCEICRVVRTSPAWQMLPVVVVTADISPEQRIAAFEAGADDYVCKPFGMAEFIARVRSVVRRRLLEVTPEPVFAVGGLRIDLARRVVTVNGALVRLSPKQYQLLRILAQNAGKVVTHRQLLGEIWGPAHLEEVQYLRVFMRKLRSRVEADTNRPEYLMTELGVGYRLRSPDQHAEGV